MNNKRRILKDYIPEMSDLERRLPSCFGWRPLSVPQDCVGEMTEGLIVGTPVFCYSTKPKGGTKQNKTHNHKTATMTTILIHRDTLFESYTGRNVCALTQTQTATNTMVSACKVFAFFPSLAHRKKK